jgi:hypothetical protein
LKNKGLLTTTIVFFLTINTAYYWEGKLGFFAFPVSALLIVVYFVLVAALIRQIYFAVIEKLADKTRLLSIGLIALVLALVFVKPFGIIDFDKLEGENVLIAQREGSASCTITLKLKDNFTFKERSVCFGVTELNGKHHLQNDTIYFDDVELRRNQDKFYKLAVVRLSKSKQDGKHFDLIRYTDLTDTIGNALRVTKNELSKMKDKKRNH